jgi:hypothetical protein
MYLTQRQQQLSAELLANLQQSCVVVEAGAAGVIDCRFA